jgi:hypothetical protein
MNIFRMRKQKSGMCLIICICVSFLTVANSTHASEAFAQDSNLNALRIFQQGEIDASHLADIEKKLKFVQNFDVDHHRILSIVEWGAGSAIGTVIAASEGVGRNSGCSIYERTGSGDFEFVTGGPFCHFVKGPVGRMTKDFGRVGFDASIRQWYDGPSTPITFELNFDAGRNILCDPVSQSEAFRCRGGALP